MMAALFALNGTKTMQAIETQTTQLLEKVTGLQAVGRMISRKNLKTLRDAHQILGDLIQAAQQMESSRIYFDGERLVFGGSRQCQ